MSIQTRAPPVWGKVMVVMVGCCILLLHIIPTPVRMAPLITACVALSSVGKYCSSYDAPMRGDVIQTLSKVEPGRMVMMKGGGDSAMYCLVIY